MTQLTEPNAQQEHLIDLASRFATAAERAVARHGVGASHGSCSCSSELSKPDFAGGYAGERHGLASLCLLQTSSAEVTSRSSL
jgi:hypothetical protein